MKDYKNLFQAKFKKLEKAINKSFQAIRRIEVKKKRSAILPEIRRILFNFPAMILSCAFIILVILIVSFTSFKKGSLGAYESSYIGMVKIQEEFDSMLNINAAGGNEIKIDDTNNNGLKFFFYKIKQGESLYTISKKLGVSMDTLISLNSIENAQNLENGKRILIPNLQGIIYSVKKGDTLEIIASKYKISV